MLATTFLAGRVPCSVPQFVHTLVNAPRRIVAMCLRRSPASCIIMPTLAPRPTRFQTPQRWPRDRVDVTLIMAPAGLPLA